MMTAHRFHFHRYGIAALAALVLFVTTLPGRAAAPVAFTSAYTDLNLRCRYDNTGASEGSDAPMYCTGYGNYRLMVSFSALAADIFVESRNQSFSRLLADGQAPGYTREKGRKAEWRLADGKPFAVILRAFTYRAGPDGTPDFSRKTGERLVIKGLAGFEHIDFTVDARATPNANVRARQLADDGYSAVGSAGIPPAFPGSAGIPPAFPGSAGVPPAFPGSVGVPPAFPGSVGVPPAFPGSAGIPPAFPGARASRPHFLERGHPACISWSAGVPPAFPGARASRLHFLGARASRPHFLERGHPARISWERGRPARMNPLLEITVAPPIIPVASATVELGRGVQTRNGFQSPDCAIHNVHAGGTPALPSSSRSDDREIAMPVTPWLGTPWTWAVGLGYNRIFAA